MPTWVYIGLELELRGKRGQIRCADVGLYWSGGGTERQESTDKSELTC